MTCYYGVKMPGGLACVVKACCNQRGHTILAAGVHIGYNDFAVNLADGVGNQVCLAASRHAWVYPHTVEFVHITCLRLPADAAAQRGRMGNAVCNDSHAAVGVALEKAESLGAGTFSVQVMVFLYHLQCIAVRYGFD